MIEYVLYYLLVGVVLTVLIGIRDVGNVKRALRLDGVIILVWTMVVVALTWSIWVWFVIYDWVGGKL